MDADFRRQVRCEAPRAMPQNTLDWRVAMTSKPRLTDILKGAKSGDRVEAGISEYGRRYGGLDERKTDYLNFERS